MRKFKRYSQNLCIVTKNDADYIMSYDTLVAKIDYAKKEAQVLGYWSQTTSKHINYACGELRLNKVGI
jgi:hypothetical protein